MTYEQQVWRDEQAGGTPISAARLNYMEQGIGDLDVRVRYASASEVMDGARDDVIVSPARLRGLRVGPHMFGGKGDGTTDDTAACQAALAWVKDHGALTGGVAYFPTGVWLTGPLVHPSRVVIEGASSPGSIIRLKPGSNADLLVSEGFAQNTGTTNNGPNRLGLRTITLDADRVNQTARARCWVVYGYNTTVDDVWFVNGFLGGVYSEWGGNDTPQPMESQWSNYKIWNYGGQPGSVGLDWNGPHDSQHSQFVVATLDSTIRPTDVPYGATPINGNAVAIPSNSANGGSGTFTFVCTGAADPVVYPETGGRFVIPTLNSLETWAWVNYTSASTVGGVTTFSGCTCVLGTNRTVPANGGIVVPTWGVRINGGPGNKGETGFHINAPHIWGRNHFALHPVSGPPLFASNVELEGAFIANLILSTLSTVTGVIYGTGGQGGQTNEAGFQIGQPGVGARNTTFIGAVFNVGGAQSANGCSGMVVNSAGYNYVIATGTTSHPSLYVKPYGGSSDRIFAQCQNNTALSTEVDNTGIVSNRSSVVRTARLTPTYGVTVTPDAKGAWHTITATNGTAFTIANPTNPPAINAATAPFQVTQDLTVEVFNNTAAALGAVTWGSAFLWAGQTWTSPAAGKRRLARFGWNGSNWVCLSVSAADY